MSDYKHLGLTLDPKLKFAKHFSEKNSIARKGIGIIKHLAPYLPLKSREQIFKMHIRPHLDYCDMIYHIPVATRETNNFDFTRTLSHQMTTLERIQYQAALTVTGVWKGTNTEKIMVNLVGKPLMRDACLDALHNFTKLCMA